MKDTEDPRPPTRRRRSSGSASRKTSAGAAGQNGAAPAAIPAAPAAPAAPESKATGRRIAPEPRRETSPRPESERKSGTSRRAARGRSEAPRADSERGARRPLPESQRGARRPAPASQRGGVRAAPERQRETLERAASDPNFMWIAPASAGSRTEGPPRVLVRGARVSRLSHVGPGGETRMVDVTEKPATRRRGVAAGRVRLGPAAAAAVREDRVTKGNVFETARLAAICAAKRTADLLPLCHTVPLDHVEIDLALDGNDAVIRASVSAWGRTGVEMEALTAATVAALTIYDMLKAVERGIEIGPIFLLEKSGGRSGAYRREHLGPERRGPATG